MTGTESIAGARAIARGRDGKISTITPAIAPAIMRRRHEGDPAWRA